MAALFNMPPRKSAGPIRINRRDFYRVLKPMLNQKAHEMSSTTPRLIHGCSASFAAAALCGASFAAETSAQSVGPGKAYTYKISGGEERQMEIFFPPNHDPAKSKVPGIICFHGGAWLGGSLAEFRRTCAYFASRGLVCATANYQMLKIQQS